MQLVDKCFDSVKKDYLRFLKNEKIFNKSKKKEIINLKKFYIPISFWIENKYKKKRRNFIFRFFWGARIWKNYSYSYFKNYSKKIF